VKPDVYEWLTGGSTTPPVGAGGALRAVPAGEGET